MENARYPALVLNWDRDAGFFNLIQSVYSLLVGIWWLDKDDRLRVRVSKRMDHGAIALYRESRSETGEDDGKAQEGCRLGSLTG